MLTGVIPATRKALDRAGLKLEDISVVEINEAFASVVLAWKKELEIPDDWFEANVNPNGGAIALGHPLGASGAKLMATLLNELERREARFASRRCARAAAGPTPPSSSACKSLIALRGAPLAPLCFTGICAASFEGW